MKIQLTKDVSILDELTYEVCVWLPVGTICHVEHETDKAYYIPGGHGIWKTEAVKFDC